MFFCEAQVVERQISTPPSLYAASFNREGIWSQHIDVPTKTIFGSSLRTIGLQKVQKMG